MVAEITGSPALHYGDAASEHVAITKVNRRSAFPGQSEHQLGTAIDLITNITFKDIGYRLEPEMDQTPAFQ